MFYYSPWFWGPLLLYATYQTLTPSSVDRLDRFILRIHYGYNYTHPHHTNHGIGSHPRAEKA